MFKCFPTLILQINHLHVFNHIVCLTANKRKNDKELKSALTIHTCACTYVSKHESGPWMSYLCTLTRYPGMQLASKIAQRVGSYSTSIVGASQVAS